MAYSEGEAVFFKKLRATLEYGLHRANVATGELASAKAVSEGTAFFYLCK